MNAKIARLDLAPADPRIEDYLAGRLDAASEQRFELEMIASTELQAQVRDAYALRELVRSQSGQLTPSQGRPSPRPRIYPALAMAAGLGALVVGIPAAWWTQQQTRAQEQLSTELGALRQQIDALGQVQLGLPVIHLGPLRSLQDESAPLLRKRPDVGWVRLSISTELLADAPVTSRQLSLVGPTGVSMPLAGGEQWSLDGGDYSLLLPLARLQPGSYRLVVETVGSSTLSLPFEVLAEQAE